MESRTTSSPESRRPPIVGESLVGVGVGVVVGGGDAVPAAPAVPAVVLLDVSLSSYVFFSAFSRSFLGGKSVESVNNTHPSDPSLFLFSLKISSKRGSTNKDSIGSSASSVSPLSPMLFLMRSGDARPFSSKKDFLASSTSAFTVAFVAFVVGVVISGTGQIKFELIDTFSTTTKDFTTDHLNRIYLIDNNQIVKLNHAGDTLYVYSNKTLGNINGKSLLRNFYYKWVQLCFYPTYDITINS